MNYGHVLERKLVNALIADAEAVDVPVPIVREAVSPVLRWFKSYYKGLWVGGEVQLTDTHVVFQTNSINKLAHTADTSFAVPLRSISEVAVEPGFLTKIIAMQTPEHVYRIRCFGAAAFAERIRQRAQMAH